jgi:hypothetical protein
MAREISLFVAELENAREKNLNPSNNQNSMAKNPKILPIDDTQEIEGDIIKKKEQVLKEKVKKENQNKDTIEITKETSEEDQQEQERADEKEKQVAVAEEYPEFEIGFDPFKQQ